MTPKKFSQIFSIWVRKNAELDANFKSVDKVAKSLHEELLRAENFSTHT
jgi:hypothetical protein